MIAQTVNGKTLKTPDETFADGESEARRILTSTPAYCVSVFPLSTKVFYRNDVDNFEYRPPDEWSLTKVRKLDSITVLTFER
jgi:hypothetical protein